MKKHMDKLKSKIRINKNLFVFLLIIVGVGIAAGALFASILKSDDKKMVADYLNGFLNNVYNGKLEYNISLINTLIFTLGFAFIIWILGISVIGFVLILLFLFIKAFVIGFSIGSIILNFKFKGILIAFGYVVPHHIINIMIYILLSAYALIVSFKLISSITGKKTLNFKYIMNRYCFVLVFSLIILFLSSIYEVYLLPNVMKILTTIIK